MVIVVAEAVVVVAVAVAACVTIVVACKLMAYTAIYKYTLQYISIQYILVFFVVPALGFGHPNLLRPSPTLA